MVYKRFYVKSKKVQIELLYNLWKVSLLKRDVQRLSVGTIMQYAFWAIKGLFEIDCHLFFRFKSKKKTNLFFFSALTHLSLKIFALMKYVASTEFNVHKVYFHSIFLLFCELFVFFLLVLQVKVSRFGHSNLLLVKKNKCSFSPFFFFNNFLFGCAPLYILRQIFLNIVCSFFIFFWFRQTFLFGFLHNRSIQNSFIYKLSQNNQIPLTYFLWLFFYEIKHQTLLYQTISKSLKIIIWKSFKKPAKSLPKQTVYRLGVSTYKVYRLEYAKYNCTKHILFKNFWSTCPYFKIKTFLASSVRRLLSKNFCNVKNWVTIFFAKASAWLTSSIFFIKLKQMIGFKLYFVKKLTQISSVFKRFPYHYR